MDDIWGIVLVAGPAILLAALIYATIRNKRSKVPMSVTDAATKANYDAEDREVKRKEGEL